MTKEPHQTNLERAERFDVDAWVEYEKQNYVFAIELAQHAHHLRMQDKQEGRLMIHFTMYREPSQGGATLSRLCIGQDYICDVLEDEVREVPGVPVSEWKIPGATAIPAGLYEIEARQSGHFGPDTLTLLDVPGYQYIRIHGGNTIGDTEGCLLPGVRNSQVTVAQSRVSLERIKAIAIPALRAGKKVEIEIVPATGVQA